MSDRNKGQTIVEFALVVPLMMFIFFSSIYAGIMFLDYTQYNNAARNAARDVSLQATFDAKKNLVDKINNKNETLLKRYASQLTNLYDATWQAEFTDEDGNPTTDEAKAVDVHIVIMLSRDEILLKFLPTNLKSIDYKMRLE